VEKVQCERVEMKPERGGKMEKGKGKKKKSSEHAKAFRDSVRRVREQGDRRVMLCIDLRRAVSWPTVGTENSELHTFG